VVGDARTVILREIDVDERRMRIYTDERAGKVTQLRKHPLGTLVMWSPKLGWQLRWRVRLDVQNSGLAVSSRWAQIRLSPAAQDYLSPVPPGAEHHHRRDQPEGDRLADVDRLVGALEVRRRGCGREEEAAHAGGTFLTFISEPAS
jgi:hypothetical protein